MYWSLIGSDALDGLMEDEIEEPLLDDIKRREEKMENTALTFAKN